MKKVKWSFLLLLMIVALALPLTACSTPLVLAKPEGLVVNSDSYILSWREVPNARKYEVEITSSGYNEVMESRRNNLNITRLGEGVYTIRVRAVSGDNMEIFSEWSDEYRFEREKETGVVYMLTNNNTEYAASGITSNFEGTVVTIDDYHRGKPVTSIAIGAFSGEEDITEVIIGKNVKTIGENAFINCTGLTSFVIPENVIQLGKSAFRGCGALKSVVIPDSIEIIPELAFAYCRQLVDIDFGEGVKYIDKTAFVTCSSLEKLKLPDSVVEIRDESFINCSALASVKFGSGIQAIGGSAFENCTALASIQFTMTEGRLANDVSMGNNAFRNTGFTTVSIPEGVVSLGRRTFGDCKLLEKVTLPESLKEMGLECFNGTALYDKQVKAGDGKAVIYAGDEDTENSPLWIVGVTTALLEDPNFKYLIANEGDRGNIAAGLSGTDIVIQFKENTVGICEKAFYLAITNRDTGETNGCHITRMYLPKKLKYINNAAFAYATELTYLEMHEGDALKVIGVQSFAYCRMLNSVIFREGVEEICEYAFYKCRTLNNAARNLDGTPNLNAAKRLTPRSVKRIGMQAFYGTGMWAEAESEESTGIHKLVFAGTWLVGYDYNMMAQGAAQWSWDGQFEYDEDENHINISDTITHVSDFALYGNAFLTQINLSKMETIGQYAFAFTNLGAVSFKDDITEIEPYTFIGCASLTQVSFPHGLTSIGFAAFAACSALNEIDLKGCDQLKDIGEYAFFNCQGVTSINFNSEANIKEIKPFTFSSCMSLISLDLPVTVESIGRNAFAGCISLIELDLSKNVNLTYIGKYAFLYNTALESVIFNEGLVTIDDYAFYNNAALYDIRFSNSIETIGNFAFASNNMLSGVKLPENLKSLGDFAFSSCPVLQSVCIPAGVEYIGGNAFVGDDIAVMYLESGCKQENWSVLWNSAFRPAISGATFNEDGSVNSLTIAEGGIENMYAYMGFTAPHRKGMTFGGWTTVPDDPTTIVSLRDATPGMTLYARWVEGEETPDVPPEETPGEGGEETPDVPPAETGGDEQDDISSEN